MLLLRRGPRQPRQIDCLGYETALTAKTSSTSASVSRKGVFLILLWKSEKRTKPAFVVGCSLLKAACVFLSVDSCQANSTSCSSNSSNSLFNSTRWAISSGVGTIRERSDLRMRILPITKAWISMLLPPQCFLWLAWAKAYCSRAGEFCEASCLAISESTRCALNLILGSLARHAVMNLRSRYSQLAGQSKAAVFSPGLAATVSSS